MKHGVDDRRSRHTRQISNLRTKLTFRLMRGRITLMVSVREVTEQTVAFLRVTGHGEMSQKPSQSHVQRLVGEIEISQKLFTHQLRKTISA